MSTRSRSKPASTSVCALLVVARPELALDRRRRRTSIAAAEMTPSGVPPIPISRSTPVCGCAAAIAGATSPSRIRLHACAGLAQLADQLLVAVALEHDDR